MLSVRDFKKMIWRYYRLNGRDLPWRRTRVPYRIVVSEIMLQQTQVSRVLKKYPEFIKAFPTFAVLARAPLPKLLRTWQGMGYNRRALALKKIAQIVVEKYRGRLPRDPEQLAALPGIGRATAASIAAFAFDTPTVFIETNIRRVFIHYFFPRRKNVSDKQLLPLVEATLDVKNPREWYFALMDDGSMLAKTRELQNPNRRSVHYKRQSKFEGSDRQLRGGVLRLLMSSKTASLASLARELGTAAARLVPIMVQLEREGFVRKLRNSYTLPR